MTENVLRPSEDPSFPRCGLSIFNTHSIANRQISRGGKYLPGNSSPALFDKPVRVRCWSVVHPLLSSENKNGRSTE